MRCGPSTFTAGAVLGAPAVVMLLKLILWMVGL